MSTIGDVGSTAADWMRDLGPAIGPKVPLPDLYGEDNGGGMPFGLLDEAQIDAINESARRAGENAPGPSFGLLDEMQIDAINEAARRAGQGGPYGIPAYDDLVY